MRQSRGLRTHWEAPKPIAINGLRFPHSRIIGASRSRIIGCASGFVKDWGGVPAFSAGGWFHPVYAVISRDDHIHSVADIDGRRISLQRYVMKLRHPDRSYDDLKQVSIENKITFDCRISNLEHRVGRYQPVAVFICACDTGILRRPENRIRNFQAFRPRSSGYRRWVSPFGNLWVNGRSHLTTAYRSVPRPSSPLTAKASTRCP